MIYNRLRTSPIALIAACAILTSACAQLERRLPELGAGAGIGASGDSGLSSSDYMKAIKDALRIGVERAVERLGQRGGFLDHAAVSIPMPEQLRKLEAGLRRLGQDRYADQFVETMNRAAERAMPRASGIFFDAITRMRVADAQQIVTGPEDAATRYFRTHTYDELYEAILPIVSDVTSEVGVTSAYKTLMRRATALVPWLTGEELDLDRYVTRQALDGLFLRLAEEEQGIREQPVARTTEVLRKVFGQSQ